MRSVGILLSAALVATVASALSAAEPPPAFDPAVARRVTPEEVEKRRTAGEKPIFLDTRTRAGDDKVKGAVHVPNDRVETWAKDVPKGAFIVTYCT